MNAHCQPSSGRSRPFLVSAGILVIALVVPSPTQAIEQNLQELQLPSLLVEKGIRLEAGFELPPPAHPVEHVDQLPLHGPSPATHRS